MSLKYILSILILLGSASAAFCGELKKMSGEEWQELDRLDKVDYMMRATDALEVKDVPLSKSTDEYVDEVDTLLKDHQEYAVINVADILEMAVSNDEPEAKEVLDKLKNPQPA